MTPAEAMITAVGLLAAMAFMAVGLGALDDRRPARFWPSTTAWRSRRSAVDLAREYVACTAYAATRGRAIRSH